MPFQSLEPTIDKRQRTTSIGYDAEKSLQTCNLRFPIENGRITNWDDMELVWDHAFKRIKLSDKRILMTADPDEVNRKQLLEKFFNKYSPAAVLLANQAVLSLFASGRSTGVVINFGEGTSHVVPIYENSVIKQFVQKWDNNGKALTEKLKKTLEQAGFRPSYILAKEIKEKYCYVALDPQEEIKSFTPKSHDLSDGQRIEIGLEAFRCPEVLFQEYSIDKVILDTVRKCDSGIQKTLFANIVLTGGSTLLRGFSERLKKEIEQQAEANVEIIRLDDCTLSAWKGGCKIVSEKLFSEKWITKDEFESGADTLLSKYIYSI
ncbi:actin-1-like [Saccostrea echinata]|uniref:actin-1-like n=1 Tax=Saccostrea echinata TaxID=191078 RepID=UPI002A8142C3|nr:actin-1-like [Saccostrea echinata]